MKLKTEPRVATDQKVGRKRILIVDDHPVLRAGVGQVINAQGDMMVCAEAESCAQAMAAAATHNPDLALVDISLAERSGLELIKDLRARHPKLLLLALSLHDESLYAERVLRAGAQGYVMKREPIPTLLAAIRRVLDGNFAVSEAMKSRLVRRYAGSPGPATENQSPGQLLSDRELEVFELLGSGHGTGDIAERLHLSKKTVSCYRENIKRKLSLKSSSDLVRHAVHWAKSEQVD